MTSGKRIFGAFTIAIALFFVWPAIIGGWQKVSALRAAVQEREDLLTKREDILAKTAAAYTEYQNRLSQEDGQKFVALVPVRKDTGEVTSALEAMAAESQVTLGEIRMSEVKSKATDQYKTLALNIDLSGSYDGMLRFLSSLEQYVRLMNVDTIQATTSSQQAGVLQFSIRADAYFLK
jgi:Tfp pilus assembly protein PilO